jgi:sterol 3beta-glucosyltransferase
MTTRDALQPPVLNRRVTAPELSPSDSVGNVCISSQGSELTAQVTCEGRVDILFNERAHRLSKQLQRKVPWAVPQRDEELIPVQTFDENLQDQLGKYAGVPRLNIAVHIVGSRGDVQPFIPIAQILSKPPYSHRVRLCTHPVFKDFVEENGLEFFSIGGDPSTLMAYMVKNPGLLPGRESWISGEVGKRRAEFAVILEKCWRSCIEAGNGMDDQSREDQAAAARRPFIADAIIANPPSYGHIHCAEKLGIPLHIMFTYVLPAPLETKLTWKPECHGRQRNIFHIHLHRSRARNPIRSSRTTCRIR